MGLAWCGVVWSCEVLAWCGVVWSWFEIGLACVDLVCCGATLVRGSVVGPSIFKLQFFIFNLQFFHLQLTTCKSSFSEVITFLEVIILTSTFPWLFLSPPEETHSCRHYKTSHIRPSFNLKELKPQSRDISHRFCCFILGTLENKVACWFLLTFQF